MIGLPGWQRRHGYIGVILISISTMTQRIEPLFLMGLSIIFAYQRYNTNKLGRANMVTAIRLLLILIMPIMKFWDILVGVIIVLDVVDGQLARRLGETSNFGEIFDMECDALFVLIVTFMYWQADPTLWMAMLAGSMRYVYKVIINMIDPKASFRETRRRYASIIAGVFFIAIFYYALGAVPYRREALLVGSLLILISFGRSFGEYAVWRLKKQ